ncbi:MAG: FxDxF family PEP-CTERM protein [Thiobacillus sp.]|nr:FxDxF family PEP-CTERM protein [Thiobacillus sp.]
MKSPFPGPVLARKTFVATLLTAGTLFASSAMALTIAETETNDPSGTPGALSFANADQVSSGSHTLTGSTNPNQDVDLFAFNLAAGSTFVADLVSMTQTSIDGYQTHFYLFDSNLVGVDFDIDPSDLNGTLGIKLQTSITNAGTYYLAVAGLNNHPICNASGTCMVYDFIGSQPVYQWNNLGQGTGDYQINVTSVPEADTYAMLLAGLGLVGFAVRRRARQV